MAIKFDIGDLFADMDKLIQVAGETAANTTREKEKVLLTGVVEKLKLARRDLAEQLPKAADKLKGMAEAGMARAEQTRAELIALREKLEAAMAAAKAGRPVAPAPPPAPADAVPAPDFKLGARLRDELLGRDHPPATADPPPDPAGKDIWEDWT